MLILPFVLNANYNLLPSMVSAGLVHMAVENVLLIKVLLLKHAILVMEHKVINSMLPMMLV